MTVNELIAELQKHNGELEVKVPVLWDGYSGHVSVSNEFGVIAVEGAY